ncbi:MAG: hypothetical protein K6F83_05835 [Clostridiales bacterium]|nr:hypothetical protein [Clostridiales bacterium]
MSIFAKRLCRRRFKGIESADFMCYLDLKLFNLEMIDLADMTLKQIFEDITNTDGNKAVRKKIENIKKSVIYKKDRSISLGETAKINVNPPKNSNNDDDGGAPLKKKSFLARAAGMRRL